jgi:hypothetical protein
LSPFSGERLYEAAFSCDIDRVTVSEEKLAGVDQALEELGKSDEEISEVCNRFANAEPVDLQVADDEIGALSEGLPVVAARVPELLEVDWDDENTAIEIMDESDFVLLVDDADFEEVGAIDVARSLPPAIPQEAGEGEEGEEGEEGDGFFKKLFGGRRSSNRPP